MRIVLASRNSGKLKELTALAGNAPWLELALAPESFQPQETGDTFFANAVIKAKAAAKVTGLPSIADDSGLVVEALDGLPGVHSARFCSGEDADRRAKLLAELKNVPEDRRDAAFVCTMVVCNSQGEILHAVTRAWTGRIGFVERGQNGFGYDPIFYLSNKDVTAAELDSSEKNKLSHRGQAWREMLAYLSNHKQKF